MPLANSFVRSWGSYSGDIKSFKAYKEGNARKAYKEDNAHKAYIPREKRFSHAHARGRLGGTYFTEI